MQHPRHARSLMALSLLVASALGMGCSAIRDPQVQVRSLRTIQQTDQGARLELTLDVTNPNAQAIPLVYSSYDVQVDGATGFRFADVCNRTLPGQGRQVVVLAAAVAHDGQSLDGAAYRVSGWMSYEPPNKWRRLLTESGIPLPTVDFSQSGTLEQADTSSDRK